MCHIKKQGENYSEMENKQRFLNLLGLAMKAGKLVTGEETTLQSVRKNTVNLVILASDASENTEKKMRDKCHSYHTKLISPCTSAELSSAIGKNRMIVGVCDTGFSRKMCELMTE